MPHFHRAHRCLQGIAALASLVLSAPLPLHAEPDEEALGKSLGFPVAGDRGDSFRMPYRVGSWSAMDRVRGFQSRRVGRGDQTLPLPPIAAAPTIRYRYRDVEYTLDDYLDRRRVTALLILKNGQIVAERYRYGRTPEARFVSFSMAKSVTSLLVGIAVEKGAIASLDDAAEKYTKDLAGSPYGATSIRHLLRMSSGLTFTERYDGEDDVRRLVRAANTGQPAVVDVLRSITDRHSPAGQRFSYASAETEVLGRVLSTATGRSVAELTSEWLWKPMGAEHDAFWLLAHDGQEQTFAYFNATLRDWARLGLLLAQDGRIGDRQIVPREYLLDATEATRQPEAFRPLLATPFFGYGYQFWLLPLRERTFALQGVHGQTIYVQPSSGIVLVQTAVYQHAAPSQDRAPFEERGWFWNGVLRSLGGSVER